MGKGLNRKRSGFKFQPFSRKQKQLLTWWMPESGVSTANGIIADGAIRSGKTVCMGLSFTMWAMENFNGQNFGLCGKTVGSFERNVLGPMLQMLPGRGYSAEWRRGDKLLIISRGKVTNYFYVFGGLDERSQDLVQGITLAGVLFDEVALMPQSFVNQATARCSVAGSKWWFNCNPGGPSHWFKRLWLDDKEKKKLIHLRFTLEDNLSLTPEIRQRYKDQYEGVFYRRYILGEWCAAEGLIYPMYDEAREDPYKPTSLHPDDYALSIDYGTENAFAGLLWARDGTTWHLIAEYRYSGRDTREPKTDEEYRQDMEKFLIERIPEKILKRILADGGIKTIVDPSAASFITELRKKSRMFHVRKAKNDVMDGIRDVAVCLKNGTVKVSNECVETWKEFEGYVWDEKSNEDKPVKLDDHMMDALRYFVYTRHLAKRVEDRYQSPFNQKYQSPFGGNHG